MGRFTVEKLAEWRFDAETAAARAIEHRRSPASQSEGVFLEAARLMPDLVSEMREDVENDESELVREFVVLSSPGVQFVWKGKGHFRYHRTEHPDLEVQVDWLEEMGLASKVADFDSACVYRMHPVFVGWLRGTS